MSGRRMARLVGPRAVARAVALSGALVLAAAFPAAAGADTLTVTDCGDAVPGGGPGQLRTLMNAANPGDTIVVPACTISVAGGAGDDANQFGDLDVTKSLTIQGAGQGATILTNGDLFPDHVFHVLPGVVATVTDLSVRDSVGSSPGIGIFNAGELHLTRVTVAHNTANGQTGGGIYNAATGQLFVTDSTLTDNTAIAGGALYNAGTANIVHSSITQNITTSGAGGISNAGVLSVVDSTISGNHGNGSVGGGLENAPYGASATITGTTISGNTADYGGGGVYNAATLTLTNSTVSGNGTVLPFTSGGGILDESQTSDTAQLNLARVTVTGNSAYYGTALSFSGNAQGTIEGSIVTGDCLGGGVNGSLGHNLDAGNICFVGVGPTDLQNTNPKLGPLHDNGGPTWTHMPAADSPAVDAGGVTCATATDQRGITRPQGTGCDIGAVEWTDDVIFQDGFESGDTSAWSLTHDGGGNLSVTPGAALAGTANGLQAAVTDTTGLYVEDVSPLSETLYRARFYFDPDGFDPGEAQNHRRIRLFVMFDDAGTRRLSAIVLKRQAGSYSILQRCRLDDQSQAEAVTPTNGFVPIAPGPHWIAVEWRRASGPATADGSCSMTIDGTDTTTIPAIQNNASMLGMIRLGTQNVKTGASGTPYFDEFVSRRMGAVTP